MDQTPPETSPLDATKAGRPVKLARAALAQLPAEILRPNYARDDLRQGIVHIGLGNFHRAHQAWYLHRLMMDHKARDWGIIGAGVRPYDAAMRDKLLAQDCLTTLVQLEPTSTSVEVIGPMIDYLPIEKDNARLIEAMADPAIRIVSLTVTEGGYFIDPATGEFDATHEDIVHDAAHPATPRTAFGALIAALAKRRTAGEGPFTIQSCDNLLGNGDVVRQTVVSLARMNDPELAAWIEAKVAFPNSMVDCIVPATGPEAIENLRALGVDDAAPVTHENFRQWVIEDNFCNGRPPWESVGATITNDVHAYEDMKIRVLNAGHQMLVNAGEILSVETIAACMVDADISGLLEKVQSDEVLPFVNTVPNCTPQEYLALIITRFANPAVHDTTRRVAFDGSSRHAGFILPTVREALDAGAPVVGLALIEALWARMCTGVREDESVIAPNDPFWDDLQAIAVAAKDDPTKWLAQEQIYGSLADAPAFADAFCDWLTRLHRDGCRAVLRAYLAS
ncbi:MAG: mannitol dehydrogenase family protein [Pseudomonadota bacterium]